jgi:hypothetical protein
MNTDWILIFLSGFMIGGFICTKAESAVRVKKGADFIKKMNFAGIFGSVFVFTLSWFLFPGPFVFGLCGGYLFFTLKPGL